MKNNESQNISKFTPFEYIFNMEDLRFIFVTVNKFNHGPYMPLEVADSQESISLLHSHHFYELFFCEKGCLEIYTEGEKTKIPEGHMLCISPNIQHSSKNSGNSVIYNVRFIIKHNHTKSDFPIYQILKKHLSESYICFKPASETAQAVKRLHGISEGVESASKYTIMRHIYDFVPLLISDMTESKLSQTVLHRSVFAGTPSREYQLSLTINANFYKNITLKYIADTLYLSERQTARLIYDHYGASFTEVIRDFRMKRAAKLLRESNEPITAVAAAVGYGSVKGFYNTFKKYFGCLPLEYRKNPPEGIKP
ncbi:MAG: helix-turn-helix domain-containing protein [Clostridia bacterium]|nr:helix-turn-helix domain-containing protein [Clostridia bacterium]